MAVNIDIVMYCIHFHVFHLNEMVSSMSAVKKKVQLISFSLTHPLKLCQTGWGHLWTVIVRCLHSCSVGFTVSLSFGWAAQRQSETYPEATPVGFCFFAVCFRSLLWWAIAPVAAHPAAYFIQFPLCIWLYSSFPQFWPVFCPCHWCDGISQVMCLVFSKHRV